MQDDIQALKAEIERLKKSYSDVSELLNHYAKANTELSRAISALEQQNYELRKKVFDSLESVNQQLDELQSVNEVLDSIRGEQ